MSPSSHLDSYTAILRPYALEDPASRLRSERTLSGGDHVRCARYDRWVRLFRPEFRLSLRLRAPVRNIMLIDCVLGGIVAAGLLVYLVYALIRPERF